jgi:hypothetical protein
MSEPSWLSLIASLPTSRSGARMRLWRATKAIGAMALRDGAYLLPDTPACHETFTALAADVRQSGGDAWLVRIAPLEAHEHHAWRGLFDRAGDYAALVDEARSAGLDDLPPAQAARKMQALWRRHAQITQADHFPGSAQAECAELLARMQATVDRRIGPDEPHPVPAPRPVEQLDPADFRGRIWATRARPWVDRLASAWLIRRAIDPDARFRWLVAPADCRAGWIGFDFDGARFAPATGRVTFETLMLSFRLDDDPALRRVADLVHFIDIGGTPVREASGIEAALAGLRDHLHEDDTLLDAACAVFDGLRKTFGTSPNTVQVLSG